MRKKILQRILCFLLASVMVLSLIPMNIHADTADTENAAAEDIYYEANATTDNLSISGEEYIAGFEDGETESVTLPDITEDETTNLGEADDTVVNDEDMLIIDDGNETADDTVSDSTPSTFTASRASNVGLWASNSTVSIASGQSTLIKISYSNVPAESTLSYGISGTSFIGCSWRSSHAGYAYLKITGKNNTGGNGYVYVYLRNSAGTLLKRISMKVSINYGYASPSNLTLTAGTSGTVRIYHYGTATGIYGSFTGTGFSASWGRQYSNYYTLNIQGQTSGSGVITIDLKNKYDITIYTVKVYVTVNPSASISASPKSRTTYVGGSTNYKINFSISGSAGLKCTFPNEICTASWGSHGNGYYYLNIQGKSVGTGHLTFSLYNEDTGQDIVATTVSLKVTATSSGVHYYTYSFGNTANDFGYSSNYKIPYAAYKTMYGNTALALTEYWSSSKWGGSCYGIASTAGMFYYPSNGFNEYSFRSGANYARNLKVGDYSSTYSMNLTRLIECMQLSQSCSTIQSIKNTTSNNLKGLYNNVASAGNRPVQISIRGQEGGHALLAYKAVKQSDTERRIYVYDPNFPDNDERYIRLTTTSSGTFTSWYYHVNDSFHWGTGRTNARICYIPYSYYYSQWSNRGNLRVSDTSDLAADATSTDTDFSGSIISQSEVNLIAVNSKDFTVYRMDENEAGDDLVKTKVASYDDENGFVSDDSNIFMVDPTSLEEEEFIKFYVPTDDLYIVKNEDDTLQDDFQANIANVNVGASVSTTNDEVALIAFDGDGTIPSHAAANIMNAPAGTSYSLKVFSSESGAEDVDVYQASGTTKTANETPGVSLLGSTVTNSCSGATLHMDGDLNLDNTYTIRASASEGGTITPSGTTFVAKGEDMSYTITPGPGCVISGILVDDSYISLTEDEISRPYTYTFKDVSEKHTISAAFEAAYTDTPSNFSASVGDNGSVSLHWDSIESAEGYYLYRKVNGEKWSSKPYQKLDSKTTSFTDTSIAANTAYVYAVSAWRTVSDGIVKSKKSSSATVTYVPPIQPETPSTTPEINTQPETPAAPTIAATATLKAASNTYNSIKVSWKKVDGVSGYLLYRSTNKKSYKLVKDIKKGSTVSYTDKKLTAGKTYYYKLVSYKTVDGTTIKSIDSAVVKAKAAPAAVTLSSAKNQKGKKVKLTWKKVSSVTGYKIYRATKKNGKYKLVKTVKGSSKSWTNTKLKKGKTYYYKIRAYKTVKKKTIYGAYSAVKSVKIKK